MSEPFEIGVTLALSDGVSESMAHARRDMAQLERVLQAGGVSVQQLRMASVAALSAIRSVPAAEKPAGKERPTVRDEPAAGVTTPALVAAPAPVTVPAPIATPAPVVVAAPVGAAAPVAAAVPEPGDGRREEVQGTQEGGPPAAPRQPKVVPAAVPPARQAMPEPVAQGAPVPGERAAEMQPQQRQSVAPARLELPDLPVAASLPAAAPVPPPVVDARPAETAASGVMSVVAPLAVTQLVAPARETSANLGGGSQGWSRPAAPVEDVARGVSAAAPLAVPQALAALPPAAPQGPMAAPAAGSGVGLEPWPWPQVAGWRLPEGDGSARQPPPPAEQAAAWPAAAPFAESGGGQGQGDAPAPGPQGPSAPPAAAASAGPTEGDVFLDGALVGRWMSRFLTQEAGRASAGPTGFDARRGRLLPGATVGG